MSITMKQLPKHVAMAMGAMSIFATPAGSARAEFAMFKIDPLASSLQLVPAQFTGFLVSSGTKLADTIGIVPQGGVSQAFSTQLGGMLVGDVAGGTLTLGMQSIIVGLEHPLPEFVPSSVETGSNSVVDVFGGEAVSNFGAMDTEAHVAVRDMALRPVGGTVTVGSPANTVAVRIESTILDVKTTADPPDAFFYSLPAVVPSPVANSSTTAATGSLDGTIQVPITLTYIFDSVIQGQVLNDAGRVILVGSLTATRVIPGDFDGNRDVDSADLAKWAGDFGANGGSDADGDGDSDGHDFLLWQQAYGTDNALATGGAVPEPAAAGLGLAAILICGWSRRRTTMFKDDGRRVSRGGCARQNF
jgi:hypothetical protein